MTETERIIGFPVCVIGVDSCLTLIDEWIQRTDTPKYFVCANPHSLVAAQIDPEFQKAIHEADIVTPDGAGIVLASRLLGGNITSRVTGSDIFYGLSEKLNKSSGRSYFFLGSSQQVLSKIRQKMAIDYPNIQVVGTWSPPFKSEYSDDENKQMVDTINKAKPDVLWVGMTAPKQEKWIYQHRGQLDVKFIGAVGAVFDFYTERVQRSHPWFLNHGLEWLPRLIQEPRRLWHRNFVSNPKFIVRVLRQRLLGD